MHPKLKRYITVVGDLPAVPALASEVMRLVEDPSASAHDLRQLIERDPAVAARILKVANSSLYGFSRTIETLQHAIALLGFRTVRNLVIAACLRQAFKQFGLSEKLLWEHATVTGGVAMKLAELPRIAVPSDEAFTAGLLHDLGKIAFSNNSREQYTQVMARVYNEGIAFVVAEREAFGFDHAELGACVAEKWRLPPTLVAAIRHHHDPDAFEKLGEKEARLTALTALATVCVTRAGVGRREPVPEIQVAAHPAFEALGLADEDEEQILRVVDEQITQSGDLVA